MAWRTPVVGGLITILASTQSPAAAEVLVTNTGADYRLTVFGNGANGNAAPVRVLEGDAVLLVQPSNVFADVLHNEIYVANQFSNSIAVYPLSASGDQPPLRHLIGAATLFDRPTGVFVDFVHDELVVSNFDDGEDGFITVYPRTASGDTAPLRRIAGGATGLKWAVQPAVDPVTNEILVVCQGNGIVPAGVRVFPRTANGNVAPIRTLAGPKTKIDTPYGLHFDPAANQILVTDREGAISTFARTANGNTAPLRRIAGATSGLLETLGVSLLGTSEIVVANGGLSGNNYSDDAVLVFARNANGNVAPKRKINGPDTLLSGPTGVSVALPRLGLRNNRFGVQAIFRTEDGAVGDAIPVGLTSDTGYLWFFQSSNVEIVVKVLDGCGINNRYWVFAGGLTDVNVDLIVTDYATGLVRAYTNPQKTPFQPIQDTSAFASCNIAASPVHAGEPADAPDQRSVVGDTLLLSNDRFEVRTEWETTETSGVGHPVAITGDTGYFWFFQAGERRGGGQGARRLRDQQPLLGVRRWAHRRRGPPDRDGQDARDDQDLRQPPEDAVPADPGHLRLRHLPLIGFELNFRSPGEETNHESRPYRGGGGGVGRARERSPGKCRRGKRFSRRRADLLSRRASRSSRSTARTVTGPPATPTPGWSRRCRSSSYDEARPVGEVDREDDASRARCRPGTRRPSSTECSRANGS